MQHIFLFFRERGGVAIAAQASEMAEGRRNKTTDRFYNTLLTLKKNVFNHAANARINTLKSSLNARVAAAYYSSVSGVGQAAERRGS